MSHTSDLHSSGDVESMELVEMSQRMPKLKPYARPPIEAFPDIPGSIREPSELQNGYSRNNATKDEKGVRTPERMPKKVHFTPPASPVRELKMDSVARAELGTDSQMHVVLSVFAFIFASVALTGCILLYFECTRIRADITGLQRSIFGASDALQPELASAGRKDGILELLLNRTGKIENDLRRLGAWANTSACIAGHDFTSGQFCYRLLRFELDFWQADSFCRERNGYLAFTDDEASWNKTVLFLLGRGYKMKEVWMGVYKDGHDVWRYTDGRKASFVRWARGNIFDEGDDCAQIRLDAIITRSGLYDRRCSNIARPFLCRFKIR